MRRWIVLVCVAVFVMSFVPVFGQDDVDESIAKSLYLKASKAIRAEDYKEAERLLTQILDEYPDSDVALMADERLTDIMDKLELAGLPKTPGFYWVENDGQIYEMASRELKQGSPYQYSTVYATFAQEEIPEIFADELQKFIVYRPKGELKDVFWTSFVPLMNQDENGKHVLSGNNLMQQQWEVPSVVGEPFGSSQVVFEEIKPGMWEVGFPEVFSPSIPVCCGLRDGTGTVGLLVVQSKMVHSFYPFLKYWKKPEIDIALNNYVMKQETKHPDNPDLKFFEAILKYKAAYKENRPKTEVLALAREALAMADEGSTVTPKVYKDLGVLVEYCLADSVVRANAIAPDDSPDMQAQKQAALQSYSSESVPSDVFWIQEQIARNYCQLGEYEKAIMLADEVVKNFKDKSPKKGTTSLLGLIEVKVEVQIGKPDVPEAFNIHEALTCYDLDCEWERIKDFDGAMESEKCLAEALSLIEEGASEKDIDKAFNNARKNNKYNLHCFDEMLNYYQGIGDQKQVSKVQKYIDKAQEYWAELEMKRASS